MNQIAQQLRRLRTEHAMTQDDLAARLHVTRQAVSNWETGKTQPDLDMLEALAKSLDTPVGVLLSGHAQDDLPKRGTRGYRLGTIVCAAACLTAAVAASLLQSHLDIERSRTYSVNVPLFYLCIFLRFLAYGGGACALLCAASIPHDLRFRRKTVRIALLTASLLIFAVLFGFLLAEYLSYRSGSSLPFPDAMIFCMVHPAVVCLPAACLFFGANR